MATDFPATGLDTFSDVVTGGTVLAATTNNVQDPIEALEIKVGINSSAVVTSLDYLLKNSSSTNPGHKHTTQALTDYEEGEWTPGIEQSSSAFNGTMSYQRGDYVKIGCLVHASCWIRVSGTSTGSGTVSVTGLPFANNEDDYQQVAVIGYNNTLATNCTRAWVTSTKMVITDPGPTNGNYSGTVTDAGSTSDLSLTVTYTTDG